MVYTYTSTGQCGSVSDSSYGTTSYSYDNRDRVVQIQQPQIGTVAQSVGYGYDERSNRTVMTTTAPSVSLVASTSYGYDSVGRLQSVLGPNDSGTATIYQYYDNGLRWKQTLPNGIVSQYTYDPLNRLTEITQIKNGATPALADYQYALDGAGNRTAITETTNYTSTQQTRQMNYGYDPAYRLTSEKDTLQAGIITNYGYDAVGNRLGLTVTNGITNSVTRSNYNELDQLMTSVGPNLSSSYSYVRGNLVSVTTNGATTAYTWDSADRLVGVALPGSVNLSYGYDADGRRVSQRGTGAGTANNNLNYLWDEQSLYENVVLETDSTNGVAKTSYVLSGSQGELISQKRVGVGFADYFLKDAHGSVRALTDNTGTLVIGQNYNYSAFGKLLSGQPASTSVTNYQYTGQQFDSATGLYDLRARYYNPGDGRFLSQDQAEYDIYRPNNFTRYLYTSNNPVNLFDPLGQEGLVGYGESLEPEKKSEPSEAEVGEETGIADAELAARNYANDTRSLYNDNVMSVSTRARKFTLAETKAKVNGVERTIVSASNTNRLEGVTKIKQVVEGRGDIFIGGELGGEDQHAEIILYEWLKNIEAIDESGVIMGISNPGGVCERVCQPFFTKLIQQGIKILITNPEGIGFP